jgi:hypothetical protein
MSGTISGMPLDWDKLRMRIFTQLPKRDRSPMQPTSCTFPSRPSAGRSARWSRMSEQAVPPPRPRPDPHRTGRNALPHGARSADEAGKRQGAADGERRTSHQGKLRVTTTVGLGQGWLTDKVQEFLQLYPDMQIQLILDNEEVDVNMRHADCAIRLRQPQQSDLIQRKLFTVHMHVYAAPSYINRHLASRRRSRISTITGSSPSASRRQTICSTSTGWNRRPGFGQQAHAAPADQQPDLDQARLPARHRHRHDARLYRRP